MNGEIDGIVGIWHSDERAEALLYSTPLIDNQMVFFKRKGENIAFKNYEDLKQQGYRLGSVRGYMMPEGLSKNIQKNMGIPLSCETDPISSKPAMIKIYIKQIVRTYDFGKRTQ